MTNFKKILSLTLALVMIICTVLSLDFTAFATESVEPTEATVEPTTESEAETTAPTEAPTVVTTEGETELETETQEQTEAPTQEPTVDPEKVDSITTVKKDLGTTDSLKISWGAVEGADGYRIYYKNNDLHTEFRPLINTKGTSFSLKGLSHSTPYEFKISAFVVKFGKIYQSEPVIAKTGTELAATNTPVLKRSSTLIQISWNKNSKADGYYIYREDASTKGKLVLYKTITNNSTTTFDDTNVNQGRAYNYQVKAYREMYSGITFTSSGSTLRTLAGLSAPGLVSCTTQLRRVSFVWNKNSYAKGYDVMYSTSSSGPFTLLKSTTETFLNTKRLENGKTYYFRIIPYTYVGAAQHKVSGTYLSQNKTVSNKAYGKTIGKTYIEISIKQQRMWYYVNDEIYVETPVVTGNVGAYATPTGAYTIFQKLSPATLTGPTWSSYVQYWMAFTYSGCGIHDASWRSASEFGGTTYMGNGSHGCVNTPYDAVKKMYNKATIGTHVVVY